MLRARNAMTDIKQEVTIEVEGPDGLPVKLTIRPMNPAVRLQVERATRKAYCAAVRAGYRTEAEAGVSDQSLAGDREMVELRAAIAADEVQLAAEDLSADERALVAWTLRENRSRLAEMVANASMKKPTAEAVALQAQLEVVVALCIYDASGRRWFRSADQFRRHAADPFSYRVAEVVSHVFYGFKYAEPPEERFFREHGLAA